MNLKKEEWTLKHLQEHLQYAVNLEVWTIPFYMSAMFSIKDRSSDAFQLIQSVVHQEMLHAQLASNLCNAFGFSPEFPTPDYKDKVPHVNFDLDTPNPKKEFRPYSFEIGPLDEPRVNGMCLIEYPEYETGHEPDLRDEVTEYGSIGEFYDAVEYGATLLASEIRGGVNQVDLFSAFYRNLPKMTVEASGKEGLNQVALLVDTIRDQGEGRKTNENIEEPFQNTADDSDPELSHFEKFVRIREESTFPPTYPLKSPDEVTDRDRELQQILVENFAEMLRSLEELFSGKNPVEFEALMVTIGGNITNCWKHGVLPTFSNGS